MDDITRACTSCFVCHTQCCGDTLFWKNNLQVAQGTYWIRIYKHTSLHTYIHTNVYMYTYNIILHTHMHVTYYILNINIIFHSEYYVLYDIYFILHTLHICPNISFTEE